MTDQLCSDCPPLGYPTDKTRCKSCPKQMDQINPWREDWDNAPRDGSDIEVAYQNGNDLDVCIAMWSDRPVCMLGSRNGGFPPGWAVGRDAETDTNLPLDQPDLWRPLTA